MPQRDNETYDKLTRHYDETGHFYFLRRGQPIDVMRYLPQFLKEEPEFLKVQDALSWEHEKLKAKAMDILNRHWGIKAVPVVSQASFPVCAGSPKIISQSPDPKQIQPNIPQSKSVFMCLFIFLLPLTSEL